MILIFGLGGNLSPNLFRNYVLLYDSPPVLPETKGTLCTSTEFMNHDIIKWDEAMRPQYIAKECYNYE